MKIGNRFHFHASQGVPQAYERLLRREKGGAKTRWSGVWHAHKLVLSLGNSGIYRGVTPKLTPKFPEIACGAGLIEIKIAVVWLRLSHSMPEGS